MSPVEAERVISIMSSLSLLTPGSLTAVSPFGRMTVRRLFKLATNDKPRFREALVDRTLRRVTKERGLPNRVSLHESEDSLLRKLDSIAWYHDRDINGVLTRDEWTEIARVKRELREIKERVRKIKELEGVVRMQVDEAIARFGEGTLG